MGKTAALFCLVDGFCQQFEPLLQQHMLDETRAATSSAAPQGRCRCPSVVYLCLSSQNPAWQCGTLGTPGHELTPFLVQKSGIFTFL
jgi:hypothetical protein